MVRNVTRNIGRYLVVAADDLGVSSSVNRAVAEAHDKGILTAASIMAGGEAFDEAVRLACDRNRLSIGLHLTLCDGRAVLSHREAPDLVDVNGYFEKSPSLAWMKYTNPGLLRQLDLEITAQFDRLEEAGISPSHVDSHHHLHMHPVIFAMACRQASKRGLHWVRVPSEPLTFVRRFRSSFRGAMPFIEWAVFGASGIFNSVTARRYGLHAANKVYGLSRTGHIDERYMIDVLARTYGVTEVFTHPDESTISGQRELKALTSKAVCDRLRSLGITLAGYRELSKEAVFLNSILEIL